MCLKLINYLIAENASMKHKYMKELANDKSLKALYSNSQIRKISNHTKLQEEMATLKDKKSNFKQGISRTLET